MTGRRRVKLLNTFLGASALYPASPHTGRAVRALSLVIYKNGCQDVTAQNHGEN